MKCPGIRSFAFQPDRDAYIKHAGIERVSMKAACLGVVVAVAATVVSFVLEYSDVTCIGAFVGSAVVTVIVAIPYSRYSAGKALDNSPVLAAPMKLHFNENSFALCTSVRSDLEDHHHLTLWRITPDSMHVLMLRPTLGERVVPIRISDIEDSAVRDDFVGFITDGRLWGKLVPAEGWCLCRGCGDLVQTSEKMDGQEACVRCKETFQQRLREGVVMAKHRTKIGRFAVPVILAVLDTFLCVLAFGLAQDFPFYRVAPWSRPLERIMNEGFLAALFFSACTVVAFLGTWFACWEVGKAGRFDEHPLLKALFLWTALLAVAGSLPMILL